ncbi:hypothetical protein L207DRAFT_484175 [Hyaloscypha variabilis F]|uniref:Uncharacterized protein n=1 Tax=Hyaloscypha variabilis (strain UAMH 11265 / GT02V1 / F) TaxID=1149755 RepID=A0A2J6RX22_HYAVF|nr:hypothetical protein L207DRAFT_484175 [Hyaloscypha variabilis F]
MFYRPNSMWSWTLLAANVIETGTVLTIEALIFTEVQLHLTLNVLATPESKTIPSFLTLLIFGFIYQALLLYDTLAQRNTIQLIGLCIFAACLFIYAVLQIDEVEKVILVLLSFHRLIPASDVYFIRPLSIANAVLTGLYTTTIALVSFKLYSEFQWTIYRLLNADLKMQQRYFTFKIYVTLLKFDVFFFLGFMIQFLAIAVGDGGAESALTIAYIPFIVMTLSVSTWFMRRENTTGMLVVLCLHLASFAFFIFKFARMYQPSHAPDYLPARKILTYFGVITLLLSFLIIVVAVKCIANFNKGLKIHINSNRLARGLLEDYEMEMSESRNLTSVQREE